MESGCSVNIYFINKVNSKNRRIESSLYARLYYKHCRCIDSLNPPYNHVRTYIFYSSVTDEVPEVQRIREPTLSHMLGSRVEWMGGHRWANG